MQDYIFDVISAFIQTEFDAIRAKKLRKTLKWYTKINNIHNFHQGQLDFFPEVFSLQFNQQYHADARGMVSKKNT